MAMRGLQVIDEIYSLYPHKVSKKTAFRAIEKVLKEGVDPEWLKERVKLFANSSAGKKHGLFAGYMPPYPATWFNAGRYDDDESCWQGVAEEDEKCPRCQGPLWLPSLLTPGRVRECDCVRRGL